MEHDVYKIDRGSKFCLKFFMILEIKIFQEFVQRRGVMKYDVDKTDGLANDELT